jgi:hypothetical protein
MRFALTTFDDPRAIEMRLFGLQANAFQLVTALRQGVSILDADVRIRSEQTGDAMRIVEIATLDGRFVAEVRAVHGEIVISNRAPDGTLSDDTRSLVTRVVAQMMRHLAERSHMTEFELGRDLAMLFAGASR